MYHFGIIMTGAKFPKAEDLSNAVQCRPTRFYTEALLLVLLGRYIYVIIRPYFKCLEYLFFENDSSVIKII